MIFSSILEKDPYNIFSYPNLIRILSRSVFPLALLAAVIWISWSYLKNTPSSRLLDQYRTELDSPAAQIFYKADLQTKFIKIQNLKKEDRNHLKKIITAAMKETGQTDFITYRPGKGIKSENFNINFTTNKTIVNWKEQNDTIMNQYSRTPTSEDKKMREYLETIIKREQTAPVKQHRPE